MNSYLRIEPPYQLKFYIFLNNYMTSFGLIIFLFALIFTAGKFTYLDLPSVAFSYAKTDQIAGEIVESFSTGFDLGNHVVIAYDYKIYHPEFGILNGTSFDRFSNLLVGDEVTVEYLINNPQVHRIVGMHNSFVNDVTIVFWVIWFIGLILIGLGVRKTNSFLRHVKYGFITTARLSKRPTTKIVDETRFFVLEFSFLTKEGVVVKIHKELSNVRNILDDKEEYILYYEKEPKRNYFVDRLPGKLKNYIYDQIQTLQNT